MQAPQTQPGLWRRTPPAIFPPILGLFGIGLAWRRAGDAFGVPVAVGDLILGAVTLLYLFALVAYLAKVLRRPGVVAEDLRVLPGRAGLAAMTLSGMLLAASLVSFSEQLARVVLIAAVAGHVVLALMILLGLARGPAEARVVTPVWHLSFVGFIVSPLAAAPLGWDGYATFILYATGVIAFFIWGVSLAQMLRKSTPPPLRPTLAIHLAPASLLGTVAILVGQMRLGFVLGILALAIMVLLLLRARWLTAAGFSPLWGAFTFPLAAFSTLMMLVYSTGGGEVFRILGGLALVAGTIVIPWIATKVLQLWAKGVLAAKTNAAVA